MSNKHENNNICLKNELYEENDNKIGTVQKILERPRKVEKDEMENRSSFTGISYRSHQQHNC